MNKLQIISKLAVKFTQKYLKEYILLLLKPIGILCLGFLSLFLAISGTFNPILSLFIVFPCIIYSFWRGLLITYSLNYAAYDLIKENKNITLAEALVLTKKRENELKIWVSLASLILVLGYIPSFYTIYIDLINFQTPSINFYMIASSFLLAPLTNYFMQVFYFKKDEENYIRLILNCYKIDVLGWIIAILITLIYIGISSTVLIVLSPLFIVFSLSISTFYFISRKTT